MEKKTEMVMRNKVLECREKVEWMSQEKLAEIIGVGQKTISNIENHTHIPNVLIAMRLADIFDVDIYKLFEDVNWERREKGL